LATSLEEFGAGTDYRFMSVHSWCVALVPRVYAHICSRLQVNAALIALGKEDELISPHTPGLLKQGFTPEQFEEMCLHLAHYSGWPTVHNADCFADLRYEILFVVAFAFMNSLVCCVVMYHPCDLGCCWAACVGLCEKECMAGQTVIPSIFVLHFKKTALVLPLYHIHTHLHLA
jgi:hypothetical protein